MKPDASGNSETVYEVLAALYDGLWPRTDDLAFYSNLAAQFGDPVLELACGTGRISLHLAAHGHRVTGIDLSPSMLSRAVEKVPSTLAHLVNFCREDMTTFDFRASFPLIIAAFNCICELPSSEARVATYRRCLKHLTRTGALAIDASLRTAAEPTIFTPGDCVRYRGSTTIAEGHVIQTFTSDRFDEHTMQIHKVIFLDNVQDGIVRRNTLTLHLQYVPPEQTTMELVMAGFRSVAVYGGFSFEPLHRAAAGVRARQIFIAHP